jgi:phage/plasmid-associated DNA primase
MALDNTLKQVRLRISKIEFVITKLSTTSFIKSSMELLRYKCFQDDFMSKLDVNDYLFCCENGVFDFTTGVFRDGQRNDMLSTCCNNKFPIIENMNDEESTEFEKHQNDLDSFFKQVFVRDDLRGNMIDFLSSMLIGGNLDQVFVIWSGSGRNSKSKLNNMFIKMMGDYSVTLEPSYICGKRPASGAADPETAMLVGKRALSVNEPNEGDRLNVGTVKCRTGDEESTTCRGLFRDPFAFKIKATLYMLCNKLIRIGKADDEGIWRRVKCFPFESYFCDSTRIPDPENEYEFSNNIMDTGFIIEIM